MPTNSTLSARIVLSSTTLFPNPANSDVTATEVVSGSADFSTIVAPANNTTTLYGPSTAAGGQNTVYFYAASPSTNAVTMSLVVSNSLGIGSKVSVLRPGDFTYIPLFVDGAGVKVEAINTSPSTGSVLNVFYGVR